jgi:predicted dehydrogenase
MGKSVSEGKIRLGFIGAGNFAEANLYPSLSTHFFDDIERAAICDLKIEKANRLADKYGWKKTYTDFGEMISKEKLDAVVICLSAKLHPIVAPKVLENRIPVFLEKPSSIDLEGTVKIAEAAKKANVPVQVDHQKRHGLAFRRALETLRNKKLFGNIIQIESKQHGFPVFQTFYSCMLEWQVHNIDLVRYFVGDVVSVHAEALPTGKATGALVSTLRFDSGAVGVLCWGTHGGPGCFCERIEVLGDKNKGVIITNAREVTIYDKDEGETWTSDWDPISKNQSHVFNGYVGGLRNFVDSVKKEQEPNPSIFEEVKTMKCLTEIAGKAGIPIDWKPAATLL